MRRVSLVDPSDSDVHEDAAAALDFDDVVDLRERPTVVEVLIAGGSDDPGVLHHGFGFAHRVEAIGR